MGKEKNDNDKKLEFLEMDIDKKEEFLDYIHQERSWNRSALNFANKENIQSIF